MSIIYLIGKSLFNTRILEIYLSACKLQAQGGQQVSIVFLQDGVLVASRGNSFESQLLEMKENGIKIYFRKEDLNARAINGTNVIPAGVSIDTKEMIAIIAEATTIVSVL